MKTLYSAITFLAAMLLPASAFAQQQKDADFRPLVESFQMQRDGSNIVVQLTVNLGDHRVPANEAMLLTPVLQTAEGTAVQHTFPAVGVYGRQRWIQYTREYNKLTGASEISYKASKRPGRLEYRQFVEYQPWMDGAQLMLMRDDYGCCRSLLREDSIELGRYYGPVPFRPRMVFIRPEAEGTKTRAISGTAWVQFPVDRIEIYPERYNNPAELNKIRASIDSVRADADVTIRRVELKGFASPESPYEHNTYLAKGRTASVKTYVQNLYRFPEGIITTDYEPEDWAGLRERVINSGMQNREAILQLIDADMDPDRKEDLIKKQFPDDYRFMLQEYYPALRHTNYRIEYEIREFNDTAAIRRMVRQAPQKLSLNEFYLAAQGLPERSPEFTEIWETAVRMYPADQVANANAAAVALQKGDLQAAEKYLAKAGQGKEVTFCRGVMAVLRDDYNAAEQLLRQAQQQGVNEAQEALQTLQRIKQHGREK